MIFRRALERFQFVRLFGRVARLLLFSIALTGALLHQGTMASSFDFRIQDYKPDRIFDKQWQFGAEWSAEGLRASQNRVLSYWYLAYENRDKGSSYDDHEVTLFTAFRKKNRSLQREIDISHSGWYTYTNTSGNSDTFSCSNCNGTGSLESTAADPKLYRHDLNLRSQVSCRQTISDPIGLFGVLHFGLRGEESWGKQYDSYNRYTTVSVYHRWEFLERRTTARHSEYIAELGIQTGISIGQQHEGKYSSAVLYLLEEFEKAGMLYRIPSSSEIRVLCDTAVKYVNAYATDDRRHRVDLLTAITGTLEQMQVLRGTTTQSTFMIDDLWYNMTYGTRPFGFEIRLGQRGTYSHNIERSSGTEWRYTRQVTTPIDTPNATVVSEQTTVRRNDNSNWEGTAKLTMSNYMQVNYGLPLSSRWQWDISLLAMSGDITFDYAEDRDHITEDRWWDNASAGLVSELSFHATKRTIYSAGVTADIRKARGPYSGYGFILSDGGGRFREATTHVSILRWIVPEFALNIHLHASASHFSMASPGKHVNSWNRQYGIALGVVVRGGY